MMEFLFTFTALLLTVSAMAVGVLFGRAAIRGSCGGLGNSTGTCVCSEERQAQCKKRQS